MIGGWTIGNYYLYEADGETLVAANQNEPILRVGEDALPAGTYYLKLHGWNPVVEAGGYRMRLHSVDIDGAIFPDAHLEAYVRAVLGIYHSELTDAELQSLTGLGYRAGNIVDLSGLERCTNLETFWIAGGVRDISPLDQLDALERVELTGTEISDLSPLAELPALSELMVDWNPLGPDAYRNTIPALQDRGVSVSFSSPGSISGTVFEDQDANGLQETGDAGIPGVVTYLDADDSATLDWTDADADGLWDEGEGERWVATDAQGNYEFTDVYPVEYTGLGSHLVRQVIPEGYLQVTPAGDAAHEFVLAADQAVTDANFANRTALALESAIAKLAPDAWFCLDETSGTTLDSSSGGLYDATLHGAPVLDAPDVFGRAGSAVAFPGTEDWASISGSLLDGATDFSIAIWFRQEPGAAGGARTYLISGANSSRNNECLLGIGRNEIAIYLRDAGQTWSVSKDTDDGLWHHLVLVRDAAAGEIEPYLDGDSLGSLSASGTALSISETGLVLAQDQDSVGGGFDPAQAYPGELDNLTFFRRTLTTAEIDVLQDAAAGNQIVSSDLPSMLSADTAPLTSFEIEFSDPVDFTGDAAGGFWLDDVIIEAPDATTANATAITELSGNRFRIEIPATDQEGTYTVTIGPDVLDVDGEPMDQNRNATVGEAGDSWSQSFVVDTVAPTLAVTSPAGDPTLPVGHIDITASEPLADGALSNGTVTLTGPAGTVTIDSIEELEGNVYRLHFAEQTADGDYTLRIAAAMTDTAGNPLDSDGDGTYGEAGEDDFSHVFALAVGPRLTGLVDEQFHDIADGPLESLTLTFSEPLDFTGDETGSLWLDRLTLTGLDGPITPTAIEQVGERDYRVSFAPQSSPDMLTVRLAADITDAAGNAMDQDRDGTFGEETEDAPAVSVLMGETAPVLWDGGGDGVNWHDPANWDGDVLPGADDVVLLSSPGSAAVTFSGSAGSVSVAGLFTDRPMKVTGGTLTVTGTSRIGGSLNVSGGTLKASGPDALLEADAPGAAWNCTLRADNGGTLNLTGIASLSDVNLYAETGGSILLPSATSYVGDNYHHTYIQTTGSGSRIDLSGLETLSGGGYHKQNHMYSSSTYHYYWTYVKALDGGEVTLAGDLTSYNGGKGTHITLSGEGSVLDATAVTSIANASVTVEGADLAASFDSLTSLSDVHLYAQSGGSILLPSATSYVGDNYHHTYIQASGSGSRIDLSGMETLSGGGYHKQNHMYSSSTYHYYWTYVKALDGGEIILAGDLTRNSSGYGNHITVDGQQSVVDLSRVASLYRTTLSAVNGASWELSAGWEPVWHYGNKLSADETSEFVGLADLAIDGNTLTIDAAELPVEGSLAPVGGGRYDVNGSLRVGAGGYLAGDSSGLFTISGDLLGDTTAAVAFAPAGTVRFDGAGTPDQPQRLEAMSWDIGGIDMGTVDNFFYGTIALAGSTYVKLVDESDNTPGSAPEAVYASKLVVPAGTTLDLNGLNLYAATLDVQGEIVGGSAGEVGDSLTVGTLSDEDDGNYGLGDLSLREAMAVVRMAGAPTGITFDESLAGGVIALDANHGELVLDTDVALVGPLGGPVRITALGQSRILQVLPGITADIEGIHFAGGRADSDDALADDGGALYNAGTLTLVDVSIGSCIAYGSGGGVFNAAGASLTLVDSSVGSNRATWGGAIANEGELEVRNLRLLSNHAIDHGGGLHNLGTADLQQTLLTGNHAGLGGGAYNGGTLTVDALLAAGNRASGAGGGLYNASTAAATLTDATFTGNRAEDGGGVANLDGDLNLTQVTLSGNRADGNGGGLFVSGTNAVAEAVHVTVTGNIADADQEAGGDGGGVYVASPAQMTLLNSIVAGNFRGVDWRYIDDVAGGFDPASTHNLIGTVTGSTGLESTGSVWGTDADPLDARIDRLRDNGGFAPTHAIFIDSPAAEAGDNAVTNAAGLTEDQRGHARIQDGTGDGTEQVDMGAFEHRENHVPSLTGVRPLGGAVSGRSFRIGYDYLRHMATVSDSDGDRVLFRVVGMGEGSFVRDGQPVVAGETLIGPGQDVIWQVPADLSGTVEDVLTVVATDGVGNSSPASVRVQVTEAAEKVNYAVLFSGGADEELNSPRYYQNVKRLYEVLTGRFGLSPHNVYVLSADGIDPETDRSDGADSWMGFASRVQAATAEALETTLGDLSELVDDNDHFFFWSYDHGGGSLNPATEGEEVLKGWHSDITDEQLAGWLDGIDEGWRTYAFTQCYAGGMLDNLLGPGGNLGPRQFGMSATTHYEASYGDSFAAALTGGLENGYRYTGDVYEYALTHDPRATGGEGPSAGDPVYGVEHPWAVGESFPIFHDATSAGAPTLHGVDPLEYDLVNDRVDITYDMLVAASDATDPDGDALVFRVNDVLLGTLTVDGQPVSPGVTQLRYGQTLRWMRPSGALGEVDAFTVELLDDLHASSDPVAVPVRIGQVAGTPAAENDLAEVSSQSGQVVVDVLANDRTSAGQSANERLTVKAVGVALHGDVELLGGEVVYTATPGYVGTDVFTYVVIDENDTVEMGQVEVIVTGFTASSPEVTTGYALTLMEAPPGYAALPDSWDWYGLRDSALNWQETRPLAISDDGLVSVGIHRGSAGSSNIDYYFDGGNTASYVWQIGMTVPYWAPTIEHPAAGGDPYIATATNTQMWLLPSGVEHPFDSSRTTVNGVRCVGIDGGNYALVEHWYVSPENAEDPPPPYGSILLDANTPSPLWHQLDLDVIPRDVNAAGMAVGQETDYESATMVPTAWLWDALNDAWEDRTVLSGWGGNGEADLRDVNSDGVAVGWGEYAAGQYHAMRYDDGVTVDLGTLAGDIQSFATHITDTGLVVGISGDSAWYGESTYAGEAFLYQPDGPTGGRMTGLGTLLDREGSWSIAHDVSESGVVVGSSDGLAFVYAGGVMADLNDYVQSEWTLTEATGINRHGQIIATGERDGVVRAFVLDPVDKLAPTVAEVTLNDGLIRSKLNSVSVRFSEDVSISDLARALTIYDADRQQLDLPNGSVEWDSSSYTATWHFDIDPLPYGDYSAALQPLAVADRAFNTLSIQDASPGEKVTILDITLEPSIAGRHVFYNGSVKDGNGLAVTEADEAAIGTDKVALRPGQAVGFANYTSYDRGLNGIMVDLDIASDPSGISLADFVCEMNGGSGSSWWTAAPEPTLTLLPGGGHGGSHRVALTWEDHAIERRWLQVKVKATEQTGIRSDDVFFFGNLPGDSNGDGRVSLADLSALAARWGSTDESTVDFNADGKVSLSDLSALAQSWNGSIAPMNKPHAEILARKVLYNNSALDGHTPRASQKDDGAIAPDKEPFQKGESPTPASVTGYISGINGLMLDMRALDGHVPTPADFGFRTGFGGDSADWASAPSPEIAVRRLAGTDGSDRVTLIWPDGTLVGTWLEVTVLSDDNGGSLGLEHDEVFCVGNLPGDANGDGRVSLADLSTLAGNWGSTGSTAGPSAGDFNVDGQISLADLSTLAGQWGSTLGAVTFE
ncbi:MAG: LamG-like jellyroll fold domain-containing protein [Phycisphaerae bacterium]